MEFSFEFMYELGKQDW